MDTFPHTVSVNSVAVAVAMTDWWK